VQPTPQCRFLKGVPLGGGFDRVAECDPAASEASPAVMPRPIAAPHRPDPATMKDHRDSRGNGSWHGSRIIMHALLRIIQ
jgi:hypothetical protein